MATSLWYLDLLVQSVPIIYHCYINQSTILGNCGQQLITYVSLLCHHEHS
jgi:methylaspartate ammonia-lyase